MLVLGYEDYAVQGRRLSAALGCPFDLVDLHHFPDGESKVRLPTQLPEQLILCRSLDAPNDKLIELLLTARTARELGVKRLILVAPYLCYMRQDKAFHPGEGVSQRIIGGFLAGLVDGLITTDAHLHRIDRLEQAFPGILSRNISATPLMRDFLREKSEEYLLIGPDSESAQWVEAIAENSGFRSVVAQKQRRTDEQVQIALPAGDYAGKKIMLVDDMISTGHTLISIANLLRQQGVASIDALVTHALFDDVAAHEMQMAGIGNIWSTDSITHPSNSLHLAQPLSDAVRQIESTVSSAR